MVAQGGLEEAKALMGLDPALPAAKLLGLRPLQALAAGELGQAAALESAITATRQFAKRQMTWFRHQARVEWHAQASDAARAGLAWGQAVLARGGPSSS